MPTYVYKFVDTGETIEVQQDFRDDTLTEIAHPDSGEVKPVKKVFTPVGVTFKGSGFFKTDNRGEKSSSSSSSDSGSKDGASSGDSSKSESSSDSTAGSKSSESKSSDSKSSDTKSSTSSGGSSTGKSD